MPIKRVTKCGDLLKQIRGDVKRPMFLDLMSRKSLAHRDYRTLWRDHLRDLEDGRVLFKFDDCYDLVDARFVVEGSELYKQFEEAIEWDSQNFKAATVENDNEESKDTQYPLVTTNHHSDQEDQHDEEESDIGSMEWVKNSVLGRKIEITESKFAQPLRLRTSDILYDKESDVYYVQDESRFIGRSGEPFIISSYLRLALDAMMFLAIGIVVGLLIVVVLYLANVIVINPNLVRG